ncbi:MAG: hypothetical protein ACR2FN_04180 [Chitinophagaceae bacterium]
MKLKRILILSICGSISASALGQINTAIDTSICKNKILQLNNKLLSTDLVRATAIHVNEITYKFYDTIINNFFDTAKLKIDIAKDTTYFNEEGAFDLLRNTLFAYHCWLKLNIADSIFYATIKTDWRCKPIPNDENEVKNRIGAFHRLRPCAPDFYFAFNPMTNKFMFISSSARAFEGKEKQLKSLLERLNIKTEP